MPTAQTAVPGSWTGTITVHVVTHGDSTETSTSGEGIYESTTTSTVDRDSDITDTFTFTGNDPEELEYGLESVDLVGQVANSGTAFERILTVSDKRNALGCHYLDETGSEIDGSWALGPDDAVGGVDFSDDGTYTIRFSGGAPSEEEIPKLMWITYTILEGAARDCPAAGRSEVTGFGQYGEWASSYAREVEGSLDVQNPGAVLDGSHTYALSEPAYEGTATVTWHLVHDGPIVLPFDPPEIEY